ncbi:MAG: DUF1016 family protein [Atopobiaceae bacterium]|nr:DUF1016 family protein [Atopobiaceae bacterium]
MSKLIKQDESYTAWTGELKERYRLVQIRASMAVNSAQLAFNWSVGRDIVALDLENTYGSNFYSSLSRDLTDATFGAKGFSSTNLKYMRYYYELVTDALRGNRPQLVDDFGLAEVSAIRPQLADELIRSNAAQTTTTFGQELLSIPWGHLRLLIDKCKGDTSKALFYARKTLENNWSRAMLGNFLKTDLYERQGKAVSNFAATLPAPKGDLAQEITRDPYNFDFLAIRERYDERELKDALMDNITKFLLELGTGFAFVGREYRVQIGQSEQWIDMLFYHIRLRCYVVLEVKVCDFEPAFMGQLGTYVVAVNHQLKTNEDNPTIGLLVCKSLDKVEAQYALESTSQPIGVSGYELSKLIPEDFKGSLPTIEEIEAELGGAL